MALIKFGDAVVGMSGKRGGSIYSRNKGGAYSKNWVKPTNPQTQAQQAVRALFADPTSAWATLQEASRLAYNAATANFPRVNRLGEIKLLSGKALFQSLSNNLLKIGSTPLSEPPMPGIIDNVIAPTVSFTLATSTFEINYTGALGVTDFVVLEATTGISAGITNASNRFNQIALLGVGATLPYDAYSEWSAKYGADPSLGARVSVRLYVVNQSTGQMGPYVTATCIVA